MEYTFNPTILQCKYFVTHNCSYSPERIVTDYELDFYIDGERETWIDDVYYKINKGSLILRTPGQRVCGKGDYNCFMLTLDFSSHRSLENYSRNSSTQIQPIYSSPMWNILPGVFTPLHYDDYVRIFTKLTSINTHDINDHVASQSLINQLLHLVISDSFNHYAPKITNTTDCIDDVCNYIKLHYSENLSLEDLADVAHICKNHLIRKFKSKLNISPVTYLIQYRMEIAKSLLSKTDLPVKSIAVQCGYNDYSYFCLTFKKTFSVTPAQYRAKKMLAE